MQADDTETLGRERNEGPCQAVHHESAGAFENTGTDMIDVLINIRQCHRL